MYGQQIDLEATLLRLNLIFFRLSNNRLSNNTLAIISELSYPIGEVSHNPD